MHSTLGEASTFFSCSNGRGALALEISSPEVGAAIYNDQYTTLTYVAAALHWERATERGGEDGNI